MVSEIFKYFKDQLSPYNAAEHKMVAEWSEGSLMLLRMVANTGEIEAMEAFNVDWQDPEAFEKLQIYSSLLCQQDMPLELVSAGKRAMPIPNMLVKGADLHAEMDFWHGPATQQHLIVHPVQKSMSIMWQMPIHIWQFFTQKYPAVTPRHALHKLLSIAPAAQCIQLLASHQHAWVTVQKGAQLQHCQTLTLSNDDDFIYNLLEDASLFELAPVDIPMHFYGRWTHEAPIIQKIKQYFGNTQFAGKNIASFSQDIPPHFYSYLIP